MKIRFQDLIKRNRWEDIRNSLAVIYEEERDFKEYKNVFETLQTLTPAPNEEEFYIRVFVEKDPETGKIDFDVYGSMLDSETFYAIEYCDWSEWLSYYVLEEELQNIGEVDYIAYCLWEMTYCGYSNEVIQKKVEKLANIAKAITNKEYAETKEDCPFCEGTKKVSFNNDKECSICDENGKVTVFHTSYDD